MGTYMKCRLASWHERVARMESLKKLKLPRALMDSLGTHPGIAASLSAHKLVADQGEEASYKNEKSQQDERLRGTCNGEHRAA